MKRRTFLLGLGGCLAGAALPKRLLADPQHQVPLAGPPKRLIILFQNNGTQQANFWPSAGAFTSPILEPILKDRSLASKTTVVRGVFVPHDANGTNGNEHDVGFARRFTGAKLLSVGGQPWGGATSVDQIVASAWKTDSLPFAVLASDV